MEITKPVDKILGGHDGESHHRNDRPFHSKRHHKKSRKGCSNCKSRKVKCDEAVPTCRSCYLRKTECVYPPFASTSERSQTADVSVASAGTDTALKRKSTPLYLSPGVIPPSPSFDRVDLKLLWHYTIKTCHTSFTVDASFQRLSADTLRTSVVSYALDNPFLLDTILALACLDMQAFDPSFPRRRSLDYHARAIKSYRCAVQAASPKSFPALAANSLLLTALTSQNFRDPSSQNLYIIDWMLIWRGITIILEFVGLDALIDAGFGIIFFRPAIDLVASALAIPNRLLLMTSAIPASDPDHPHMSAYLTTLKFLGSLYLHLRAGFGPNLSLRITTWLTYTPRAFMDLCKLRRPRALVILAHYAAFIMLVQEIWWLKGVGERSIADINLYLGLEWRAALSVPLAASMHTDKLSIACTILEDPTWANPERTRADIDTDFAIFREKDPHQAAFRHLQCEQQKDADTDLRVDGDFNQKEAPAVLQASRCLRERVQPTTLRPNALMRGPSRLGQVDS